MNDEMRNLAEEVEFWKAMAERWRLIGRRWEMLCYLATAGFTILVINELSR
jgi:hypothetical protein